MMANDNATARGRNPGREHHLLRDLYEPNDVHAGYGRRATRTSSRCKSMRALRIYAFTPSSPPSQERRMPKPSRDFSSAICGVVPFFICNPTEPVGNTDVNLAPGGVNPGTGIVMAEGGSQWGPGNFGFPRPVGPGRQHRRGGARFELAARQLLRHRAGDDRDGQYPERRPQSP